MIKLKDLLIEGKPLTDKDIKIGDAYQTLLKSTGDVEFVYDRGKYSGTWTIVGFQFKPRYGNPEFNSVGQTPTKGVNKLGKYKKINVSSKMKKIMIKTLEDAIKSKHKGSPETDILLHYRSDVGSLSDVLRWTKRL